MDIRALKMQNFAGINVDLLVDGVNAPPHRGIQGDIFLPPNICAAESPFGGDGGNGQIRSIVFGLRKEIPDLCAVIRKACSDYDGLDVSGQASCRNLIKISIERLSSLDSLEEAVFERVHDILKPHIEAQFPFYLTCFLPKMIERGYFHTALQAWYHLLVIDNIVNRIKSNMRNLTSSKRMLNNLISSLKGKDRSLAISCLGVLDPSAQPTGQSASSIVSGYKVDWAGPLITSQAEERRAWKCQDYKAVVCQIERQIVERCRIVDDGKNEILPSEAIRLLKAYYCKGPHTSESDSVIETLTRSLKGCGSTFASNTIMIGHVRYSVQRAFRVASGEIVVVDEPAYIELRYIELIKALTSYSVKDFRLASDSALLNALLSKYDRPSSGIRRVQNFLKVLSPPEIKTRIIEGEDGEPVIAMKPEEQPFRLSVMALMSHIHAVSESIGLVRRVETMLNELKTHQHLLMRPFLNGEMPLHEAAVALNQALIVHISRYEEILSR